MSAISCWNAIEHKKAKHNANTNEGTERTNAKQFMSLWIFWCLFLLSFWFFLVVLSSCSCSFSLWSSLFSFCYRCISVFVLHAKIEVTWRALLLLYALYSCAHKWSFLTLVLSGSIVGIGDGSFSGGGGGFAGGGGCGIRSFLVGDGGFIGFRSGSFVCVSNGEGCKFVNQRGSLRRGFCMTSHCFPEYPKYLAVANSTSTNSPLPNRP